MGSTMLALLACIGVIAATPMTDVRSNLEEFEMSSTNLDEPAYRLRDTVQPIHIRVDLDVYLAESKFNGIVELDIQVLEAGLEQLVLHQNVVSISGATIVDENNIPVPLIFPNSFTIDSYYELLKLNLENPIPTGNYTLTITYEGKINENPLDRGFYKGYYFNGNEKVEYATTQFQPFHARKAFPCFDEPQFKSTYVISIVRDKSLSTSYSNMAIADTQEVTPTRVRETFYRTPIISAYLIAFHVSDFAETSATSTAAKPIRIISRKGVESQHVYAAQVGLDITNELSEYLDFDYYGMGQGVSMKNDHIALPDFPSGAMENWGMVNYREAYLLNDPQNTNLPSKITIATIMAHELGHKWFGNLVTCFWWSNLWLNESFASFFEYFGAHLADKTLELDDQFIVDYLHSALTADASAGATPMNWTGVVDRPSISSHFSTTSYAKGASVLKMMEHFVGADTFKDALRRYLKTNAYRIGTPIDMYTAFREAVAATNTFNYVDIDVGEVLDSWVQTPGAPVVTVDVNMETGVLTISQKRYQLSGTPHSMLWQIPLSWTDSEELDFNTKPKLVLTGERTTQNSSPGHRAVFFNSAQSGLYRVNYDTHNWQMIASFLRDNREKVHKMNRAQIVNDVLFFIRSEHISIDTAFDVLSFLKEETDYYVWAGALTQLDWIRRRLEHVPAAHKEFSDYFMSLLEAVISKLGYDEQDGDSVSTKLNRMMVLNYACVNLYHEGCIADSLSKWNAFKNNSNNLVEPNYRRYVYCVGLREGDASDYNFLYNRYNSSENTADMVVMLRALPCTRDEASLEHYLEQSMYNTKVRVHDKSNTFTFALQGNKENVPIVTKFLSKNFKEIEKWYGGSDRLGTAISAFSTYLTNFKEIVEFQTFLYANQIELGPSFSTGVAVVNTAISNLNWGNNMALEIVTTLRSLNSAPAIITPFFLLLAAFAVHFLN